MGAGACAWLLLVTEMKLALVHELVLGGGGFRIGAGACTWVLLVAEMELGWSR